MGHGPSVDSGCRGNICYPLPMVSLGVVAQLLTTFLRNGGSLMKLGALAPSIQPARGLCADSFILGLRDLCLTRTSENLSHLVNSHSHVTQSLTFRVF